MPVNVIGVKDVLAGLEFIDEDMRQRIRTAIDPAMRGVAFKAKGFVPSDAGVLSGWAKPASEATAYRPFPRFNSANVRAGIGYNPGQNKIQKNGFQVSNYVYNVSAAGGIYETAGRLNPQGRAPFQMTPSKGASGTYSKRSPKSRALQEYNSNNPFAGQQFVAALEPVTSQPKIKDIRGGGRKTKGRLIYKAWAQDSPKVYDAILKAINATAVDFNKKTEIKKAA
jgi:hypothetical protein